MTGLPAHRAVAAGLVLVPEGRAILGRMTVEENLVLGRREATRRATVSAPRSRSSTVRFPVLGERRGLLAGALSGGEQQMLAFARGPARAAAHLLLLDEPSMGLSPILVTRIFDTVQAIHREGATVLLVEQNARLALDISDYAYVLERGRVVLEGAAAELAQDPRVQAAYLGGVSVANRPRA